MELSKSRHELQIRETKLDKALIANSWYIRTLDKIEKVPILSLTNITKFYGRIQALNNVSLDVPEGSVFGILGPNGSGKTTMLGIVMDVLKATNGSYKWFDEEPAPQHRKKIGTLLDTPNFYH